MWETFISWYLNYYLGKYIENLNAQQLAFALSKGELELEDVPLKRNIFRGWGLPILVKSGVVGRIRIRFNIFNYFRNEPVLISIEDVYLVAEALDFSELNPMEELTLSQELKMSALDSFEGRWKAGFDLHQKDSSSSYYSYIYPSSLRIGGAIVTKVLENLQLNVTNVHLRFEGRGTVGRDTFAFGITLGSLSVESCDNKWTPLSQAGASSNENDSFKILRMNKLGIYCDIKGEEMSGLGVAELKEAMGKPVKSSSYILYPVSPEARVRKNNSPNPLYTMNTPRFDVFLSLEKVPIQLSEDQYKQIFRMYKSLRKLARNVRLSHYRPSTPISNCPREWWLYSVQAILSLRGFRRRRKLRTWKEIVERAKDNTAYVQMYYQHLLTEEFPSAEALKLKNRMELELHYEDLIVLRKIAMFRVEELGKQESALILVPKKDGSSTSPASLQGTQKSSGLLSWIFPSWSQPDATAIALAEEDATGKAESTDFDEAILGEVQAFGKDALLGRFNFQLNTGSVLLNKRNGVFLELSFGGVSVDLSLKPRSGSHSFQVRLSSLLLKDAATKVAILSQHLTTTKEKAKSESSHSQQDTDHLFQVFYEMKPHKKAGHLVRVATRPMDLTIFPKTWDEVGQFFQVRIVEEDDLEVPYNGYEAMKERTREELAEYWERLLLSRGVEAGGDSRTAWDIQLDIFAPKLTLHGYPSTVSAIANASSRGRRDMKKEPSSSATVILDFGRFKFSNLDTSSGNISSPIIPPSASHSHPPDAGNYSDEDEEFLTPCTSPAPEEEGEPTPLLTASSPRHSLTMPTLSIPGENLEEIQAKFYKRYSLEISEVQILILTDGKEGVTSNRGKGHSSHSSQFVDKFSINLQLERRMVYSEDPLWPAITLLGFLPNLTFHLNEWKVVCLRQVLDAFSSPTKGPSGSESEGLSSFMRKREDSFSSFSESFTNFPLHQTGSITNLTKDERGKDNEGLDASFPISSSKRKGGKLFVAEFTIQTVSIGVSSRGVDVAELQVSGTRTVLTHRGDEDTEFSFVIQSLILADAVQTFGPDYQLLLASHRHVCMDSISGSLVDSEPTSPVSPASPMPPSSLSGGGKAPSECSADHLYSSSGDLGRKGLLPFSFSLGGALGTEALIVIDVALTKKEEEMVILTVQFNNLDVIANQETIVEIFQFLKTVFPSSPSTARDSSERIIPEITNQSGKRKIQANFEFHRLNVLLLRASVGLEGNRTARKIATATATSARVNCNLHEGSLTIEGSLGGLQVLNLTPEGLHHQRVLSVGGDPLVEGNYNPFGITSDDFSRDSSDHLTTALHFRYEKEEDGKGPVITLKMASLIYTHSSLFLYDLKKCMDQFQTPLTTSLKSAATYIAFGIVGGQDSSASLNISSSTSYSPFGSYNSLDGFDFEDRRESKTPCNNPTTTKLNMVFDSPIVVLPKSKESPDVLVAHLGEISVTGLNNSLMEGSRNSSPMQGSVQQFHKEGRIKYSVFIKDMSLYSLNLSQRWKMMENFKMTNPNRNSASLMRAVDLYRCDTPNAIPILHNTVIQFNLCYGSLGNIGMDESSELDVQGRVVSALKVSLTPQQYSQILDSLTNLASVSEEDFSSAEMLFSDLGERRRNWDKTKKTEKKSQVHFQSNIPPPLPSPMRGEEEDRIVITSCIEVPDLQVELVLLADRFPFISKAASIPSLSLSCSDLLFRVDKKGFLTQFNTSLKAVKVEDLSENEDSWKRVLAFSKTKMGGGSGPLRIQEYCRQDSLSTSCPNLSSVTRRKQSSLLSSPVEIPISLSSSASFGSSSLPEGRLDPCAILSGNKFSLPRRKSLFPEQVYGSAPTPPSSPRPERRLASEDEENLVKILVTMVDPKSPTFITKHGGVHKRVDVDFNVLDILLTPETFLCLRLFFSDAEEEKEVEKPIPGAHPYKPLSPPTQQDRNTETNIKIKALHLKLGKSRGHLAEAVVSSVTCDLKSRNGGNFFGCQGRLGSLEIRDLSLYAGLYPVKFTFEGEQALDFDYTRTGHDGKFRLNMSSILIVHSHRFYSEFVTLWGLLFGDLPTATGAVDWSKVKEKGQEREDLRLAGEGTQVILDIQAGAPVILIPCSSTSENMLVADLGHLSVRNKFVKERDGLLINSMSVDLIQMDLFSGELATRDSTPTPSSSSSSQKVWDLRDGFCVVRKGDHPSFLKNQCQLSLRVKRVFETGKSSGESSTSTAGTRVQGTLSALHCSIDDEKYKLIRGLLSHNIGENIGPLEDQIVIFNTSPTSFPSSSKGSHSHLYQAPSKVDLHIQLDLVNVTLQVLSSLKDPNTKGPLGRVEFIKSRFIFQGNSDGSKDIGLASQEILICDSRTEEGSGNVFTNILQQSSSGNSRENAPSSSQHFSTIPLQAEVHYRITGKGTNLTFVLNNMRLMVILDWWMEVRDFLTQEIPHPELSSPSSGGRKGDIAMMPSPLIDRSKRNSAPISVSAGIVTKRAPVLDVPESTFSLKINISNCELVAVEKTSDWDSNALILKGSAALGYTPHLERPISCNILQCEVFSCILGLESDTALSILDPTNIQFDILRQSEHESKGILDATFSLANTGKVLKVQSPSLSLRVSYYDIKMALRLIEKFGKELKQHFAKGESLEEEDEILPEGNPEDAALKSPSEIDQIVLMGFSREEAIQGLEETKGVLEDAIYFLTKAPLNRRGSTDNEREGKRPGSLSLRSSSHQSGSQAETDPGNARSPSSSSSSSLCGIEVKCSSVSVCIIDDCRDSDVPLVELSVSQLELYQDCIENSTLAECSLSGDYFNRSLSGWEPFLEPWRARIQWKKNLLGQLDDCSPIGDFPSRAPEFEVYISSRSPLEVSITSSLLLLYKTVSLNWSEDFDLQGHGILMKGDKRRPFVPFALKNETGSRLWFCTIISNSEEVFRQQQKGEMGYQSDTTGWIEVAHGSTQSFSFEARGKLRHRSTHQVKTHQLAIRVEGWKEVTPVSVDRVGTYFRVAKPEVGGNRRFPGLMDLPPTRVVLEVSLHGTAQKVVTIRSALVIKNVLPDPVELKLENSIVYPSFERAQTGGSLICQIPSGGTYPVPLHSIWAHLWIRPLIPENAYPLTYHYCTKALLAGTANQEGSRECISRTSSEDSYVAPYRFCVAVKRNDFPADCDNLVPANAMPNVAQLMSLAHRVNQIKLLSPFRLVNLLPHDVSYEVRAGSGIGGQGEGVFRGQIPPGKSVPMAHVDTSDAIEVLYQLDNFPQGVRIPIPAGGRKEEKWVQKVKVLDIMKRPLLLTVKVVRGDGGVVLVQLSCPCWVVNKSGLPLLCKQEGTSGEAAGQFQEHEVGRMVTPLMMSFPDSEGGSENLTLRVGSGLHKNSKTFWCRSFLAQNGLRVRKLAVSHCNNTPESVYMVGVETKNGVGRYRETKLVIISPRFLVDNRSSLKIQISQKAYASSFFDAKAEKTHLSLPSGCNLPFHWPRLDKEQLLCVRLLPPQENAQEQEKWSAWSGGFPVDNVDAFHINIRDTEGKCYFLRVEIVLQGPSYFIIFSDTTQLPPPFRVDNFSLVPLVFHQSCVAEERLKLTARAETSVPYSLDESTMPPHLSVGAPGGTSVLVNMDDLRYFTQLTYENFFYIAFAATFPGEESEEPEPSVGLQGVFGTGMESLQLVLDVEGTKVILNKKEKGKRSQLWRVNADGLIEHEGSSPPRDYKKPSSGSLSGEGPLLVLDIAGPAPVPSQCVPLMLRKPDKRRSSTQHWEFTLEGRLKCRVYDNLFVQAKDGFGTFADAGTAVGKTGSSWQLCKVYSCVKTDFRLAVNICPSDQSEDRSDVVLGPSQPVCYIRTDSGIPAEQAVCRQKLRPGSGILSLCVETDGPTRVLRVIDVEHPPRRYLMTHTFEENDYNTTPKCRVKVDLPSGFGVSIVACTPQREELLYGRFTGFFLEWTDTENSQILKASILNLQVDNQLFEAEKSAVIFIPSSGSRSETYDDLSSLLPAQGPPALSLFWEGMKSNLNARVFKVWELNVKPLSLIIEERLLLKLCSFFGFGTQVQNLDILQQSDFEVQKALASTANWNTRRYYFAFLKTDLSHVKLSVLTSASKLSPELSALKRRLGLTLIRFEEANVDLDPFEKAHPFETFEFLWALLIKHYRDELVSQAAVILGSTDFLGNPLGFVNDVSEGVSLMIYEGSVAALVKNVAHGLSNSAAKVTGTLGEGLGKTILDDRHEEERRRIKEEGAGSSGGYLAAGLRGFGHGLIGGVTSVVAQSYEGASNEGFMGLVTGFSKGLVGTVTKPAVGVLDLATGAASAIRDSSKTSSRMTPGRLRPTRVTLGNGGLLPVYTEAAARGQELLYELNDRKYSELFIGLETLKRGEGYESSLRIMISSENIIVFKPGKGNPIVLKVPLKELMECQLAPPISPEDKTTYIELVRYVTYLQAPCRPQVICENEQVAKRVVQQVNYAKVLYEELRHSRIGDEDDKENDNEDE